MQQLITPDPDIPCRPGMCLEYVRKTFGRPIVEPTATAAWEAAQYRHEDQDFPANVWIPLWFAIPGVPAGHVVLRAPDGSIYSTSDDSTVPHHHPSLEDLIWYYGPRVQPEYQLELQYLGWSEDISGARVITPFTINTESAEEETMPLTPDDVNAVVHGLLDFQITQAGEGMTGTMNLGQLIAEYRYNNNKIVENTAHMINTNPTQLAAQINAAGIARDVYTELGKLFQPTT